MEEIKLRNETKTISSLEVAEMLETDHWKILRKLDGDKKSEGIIKILTDNNFVVSDFFILSSYRDASGKENKCYNITKLGCEFLANKFTGEKGVLFTAKYVKRFNEMEQIILNDEQMKAQLLLKIYEGGQDGVLASKQLTVLEVGAATAPLLQKIEEDKPLTEFARHVTESNDAVDIGSFSKIVRDEHINIGRNKLFDWLRDKKYLMLNNTPYQKYINNNYFTVVEAYKDSAYGRRIFAKPLITGKGQVAILKELKKDFINTES